MISHEGYLPITEKTLNKFIDECKDGKNQEVIDWLEEQRMLGVAFLISGAFEDYEYLMYQVELKLKEN